MKIKLDNLSKDFGHEPVIDSINLSGDIGSLALIGRSGCGKSTLLRILGGILSASKGQAWIDGKLAEDASSYRKNIGFVFQQNGLFHHMTALENIALPLEKVHGMSKEEASYRANSLLKRFGLDQGAYKRPMELSGGQQQRVAIARAVAPKPEILLLDEPTSALDPEYTSEVLSMVNELKNEGMVFIIATHEMGFALHACEKIAFLEKGRLLEYGNSSELFRSPKTENLKIFLSKLLAWSV